MLSSAGKRMAICTKAVPGAPGTALDLFLPVLGKEFTLNQTLSF